jgi:hypothetical protein
MVVLMMGVVLSAREPGPAGIPQQIRYDASKEVTLRGIVSAVDVSTWAAGSFVTVSLSAENGTFAVPVGSEAQLKRNQISFAKGDAVTVVGVPGLQGGLVVGKIIKGDIVMTLLVQKAVI